jgi:hypothetical protein
MIYIACQVLIQREESNCTGKFLECGLFVSPPQAASEIASLHESRFTLRAGSDSRLRSPALPESKLPSLFWQIYGNLWLDFGAISSVVERLLHTQEVAGSNPASRIFFYFRTNLDRCGL